MLVCSVLSHVRILLTNIAFKRYHSLVFAHMHTHPDLPLGAPLITPLTLSHAHGSSHTPLRLTLPHKSSICTLTYCLLHADTENGHATHVPPPSHPLRTCACTGMPVITCILHSSHTRASRRADTNILPALGALVCRLQAAPSGGATGGCEWEEGSVGAECPRGKGLLCPHLLAFQVSPICQTGPGPGSPLKPTMSRPWRILIA